jgi:hypothetical protein
VRCGIREQGAALWLELIIAALSILFELGEGDKLPLGWAQNLRLDPRIQGAVLEN